MKGIILSEFIEFIELSLGEDRAQAIIEESRVKSGGAYSRVGQYDYQELLQLLSQAVVETSVEAGVLLQQVSDHLFMVFKRDYQVFFEGVESAAEMLTQIDDHIHVEVKKLYPDAELPKFDYTRNDDILTLNYTSPRPLAAVANSLLNACLKYFGDGETLLSADIAEDQCSAQFIIKTIN
jgi:hypothetical protein